MYENLSWYTAKKKLDVYILDLYSYMFNILSTALKKGSFLFMCQEMRSLRTMGLKGPLSGGLIFSRKGTWGERWTLQGTITYPLVN